MYKVSSITLMVTVTIFLSVDLGFARGGEKEILKATMTILADDAQPAVNAKRIFLPARMQARVQERADSRRRQVNDPALIVPANNKIGGTRRSSSPFLRKTETIILPQLPGQALEKSQKDPQESAEAK